MATFTTIESGRLCNLLKGADPSGLMQVCVLDDSTLLLGRDLFHPTIKIDLSKERALPYKEDGSISKRPSPVVQASEVRSTSSRITGLYSIEVEGKKATCHSQKELLSSGLRMIEELRPGTLEKLSSAKKRTKRIVSRNRYELFDNAHLCDKYSEQLMDGWWIGTNNSKLEAIAWLDMAAKYAGVKMRTSLE